MIVILIRVIEIIVFVIELFWDDVWENFLFRYGLLQSSVGLEGEKIQ